METLNTRLLWLANFAHDHHLRESLYKIGDAVVIKELLECLREVESSQEMPEDEKSALINKLDKTLMETTDQKNIFYKKRYPLQ